MTPVTYFYFFPFYLQLMAALSNPKVMAAMQGMMSGGAPDMAKIQELMSDPEVGPAMQKVSE